MTLIQGLWTEELRSIGFALSTAMVLALMCSGGVLKIPHNPEPGQHRQDVIGKVHFPPKPPLIGRRLIMMVIVVPAFSTTEDRKNETVLTAVVRICT